MGVITRIGSAPGLRRLVRRREAPGEVRVSPDDDDREPLWCLDCRREILFDLARCPDCGGRTATTAQLAEHTGNLRKPGTGPTDW